MVATVVFKDRDEASACDRRVGELRRSLPMRASGEFRYSHNHPRIREAFVEAVAGFSFDCHLFSIDKTEAAARPREPGENLRTLAARLVCESVARHLVRATVVLDGSGDRRFRQEIQTYVRKRANAGALPPRIAEVKVQPSHTNNLLQLADYAAGCAAGFMAGKSDASGLWRRWLEPHTVSVTSWPGVTGESGPVPSLNETGTRPFPGTVRILAQFQSHRARTTTGSSTRAGRPVTPSLPPREPQPPRRDHAALDLRGATRDRRRDVCQVVARVAPILDRARAVEHVPGHAHRLDRHARGPLP